MLDVRSTLFSRRDVMRQMLGVGGCLPFARLMSALPLGQQSTQGPASLSGLSPLSPDDDWFLNELEIANFSYFWEQASPKTGMVKDRCHVGTNDQGIVASIAATGFGLTALCIGEQRGLVASSDALERVFAALRFLWKKLPNHRGFFYHFANINTGERVWDSEVSSVDTAILLCGILTCREHFRHPEVVELADLIFDRVDWTWLSEDTSLLPHGWTPEIGFLPSRWDYYSELMMMYLLGMGSSTHPLKDETWTAWKRLTFEYDGLRYIGSFAPLFVHQYSQAWFDFRGRRDKFADYFQNSVIATEVHRRFCLELGQAVSRLQRRPVGNHRFGLESRLRDLGWAAGYGTNRRHRRAERRWRIAALPAPSHVARPENDSKPLRRSLEQVWLCERIQSPHELV